MLITQAMTWTGAPMPSNQALRAAGPTVKLLTGLPSPPTSRGLVRLTITLQMPEMHAGARQLLTRVKESIRWTSSQGLSCAPPLRQQLRHLQHQWQQNSQLNAVTPLVPDVTQKGNAWKGNFVWKSVSSIVLICLVAWVIWNARNKRANNQVPRAIINAVILKPLITQASIEHRNT